jgi:hypothetical protein
MGFRFKHIVFGRRPPVDYICHFIAGLCSVEKNFPIHLWNQLFPQAEIALNLLRISRINPKLSVWAQVHGTFDFNRTPLGPPGCRVLVQDILHALNNPSPKSPLAPRTDTQTQALHDLIALLGSVSPTTPALLVTPPTAAVPTTKTNAPLRVRFMPTEPV